VLRSHPVLQQRYLTAKHSLNTHDLSAMREVIGMPKSVLGACLGLPGIYSALFQYTGFAVTFESGINSVPVFDAHIEVYSDDKIVRVDFDSPYVKGLPVTMTVREKVNSRPGADTFGYQERIVRRTYEDPYTLEMLEFYECVVHGKAVKTSAEDAKNELELYRMILRAGEKNYKTPSSNYTRL
jgi:predicted dehydrogenase